MTYEVEFTRTAEREAYAAYRYIARSSPVNAAKWYNELEKAIHSLERFPKRCSRAPEAKVFEEEIRHLLFGAYRILFVIRNRTVYVLHIRHGARRTAVPDEIRLPDNS
jgi:plasmid stabilization system protein ParE